MRGKILFDSLVALVTENDALCPKVDAGENRNVKTLTASNKRKAITSLMMNKVRTDFE
jgi:hypothetical protein